MEMNALGNESGYGAGAIWNCCIQNGHTPIQMAEKAGHEDIVAQIKDFIQSEYLSISRVISQ